MSPQLARALAWDGRGLPPPPPAPPADYFVSGFDLFGVVERRAAREHAANTAAWKAEMEAWHIALDGARSRAQAFAADQVARLEAAGVESVRIVSSGFLGVLHVHPVAPAGGR